MCVEGKKYNATGKIQSVQWISIYAAALVTGVGGGYLAEKGDYTTGFLCLVPIYILAAAFAYFYQTQEPLRRETASKFIQDMKTICRSKRLLWAGLFVFLYQFSPSFGTPLFFIQKDIFRWSKLWIGTLSTLGTIFAVIGALFYFKFSPKIPVKKTLFFSVFLGAATTLSYLYYTPATAVVYHVAYSLLGMFIFLLLLDFMARNSISGLEAASFALLTSLSNLAVVASNFSGAVLLPRIGLEGLIVISSLTSFLCLFFIPRIIVGPGNG
ncbi:MAG: MFS transporter [Candidatus Omnitrophica bacterium]|nr:MFS transporter [Candidatus Omnitrophota bacterium]